MHTSLKNLRAFCDRNTGSRPVTLRLGTDHPHSGLRLRPMARRHQEPVIR